MRKLMKRFKLIEEYPGSPKLGDVIEPLVNPGNTSKYCYIIGSHVLSAKAVEDNPKFWKELIEVPEYVKWVSNVGAYYFGKLVTEDKFVNGKIFNTKKDAFLMNMSWQDALTPELYSKNFIPSTKEDYDLQNIPDYTGVCFKNYANDLYRISSLFEKDKVFLNRGNKRLPTHWYLRDVHELFSTGKWIQVPLEEYEELYFPKPKEYEILSYKNTWKDLFSLHIDGLYYHESWHISCRTGLKLDQNDINFHIHSIKRLADGVVFTLGDKLTEGVIENIHIGKVNTGIFINMPNYIGLPLEEAKHAPTPLFITEDGVGIRKGDYYHAYNPRVENVWTTKCNERTQLSKGILAFSTLELAKNYKELHKLSFSKKQIKEILESIATQYGSAYQYKIELEKRFGLE